MYISIKLPPEFGSFNRLRKENYPFNSLFTSYLAAVSRLGLSLKMDVDELVGYIEDRIFEGQRLPDVPEGSEPVSIRYKIAVPEDAGDDHPGVIVQKYIEGSSFTNRMAVMFIARMTLRMSAAYGTSLLRLTRLISDLEKAGAPKKRRTSSKDVQPVKQAEEKNQHQEEEVSASMPKISSRSAEIPDTQAEEEKPGSMPFFKKMTAREDAGPEEAQTPPLSAAEAARAAVSELAGLAAQAESDAPIVETNPLLNSFL